MFNVIGLIKMRPFNRSHLVTTLLLSLFLSLGGCGTKTARIIDLSYAPEGNTERAIEAETAQDFLLASREYSLLAETAIPPQKQHFQLLAARALVKGHHLKEAESMLSRTDIQGLTPIFNIRKRLLLAQLTVAKGDADRAERFLLNIRLDQTMPVALRIEFHNTRADILATSGNAFESARERTRLTPLLASKDEKQTNDHLVYLTLARLSVDMLQRMNTQPPPDVFSGWVSLVAINKQFGAMPDELEQQQELWHKQYPDHPADLDELPSITFVSDHKVERKYNHIALLLPLSSKFALQAKAVRDGFLAAYYADTTSQQKPVLKIYDVSGENGDTSVLLIKYRQAIEEGAQFIIGPLSKSGVNAIADDFDSSIPTLVLNYSDDDDVSSNFYQFALSPEDEARQVAERVWLDGHSQGIAIIPQTSWGERVYNAFYERWTQLGGQIVGTETYERNKKDFANPVKRLLHVDQSRLRAKYVRRLLGRSIKYEERRRQDVDFVFMLGFPIEARQLRPQLKFNRASRLPVYTTSHAYAGFANKTADRDMDGMMFSDMPWVLGFNSAKQKLKKTIKRQWPNQVERATRLHALGVDAYSLVNRIEQLKNFQGDRFYGETGYLYMDASQRIHRQLTWASFKYGRARIIPRAN